MVPVWPLAKPQRCTEPKARGREGRISTAVSSGSPHVFRCYVTTACGAADFRGQHSAVHYVIYVAIRYDGIREIKYTRLKGL
jgi:hypothetical protein